MADEPDDWSPEVEAIERRRQRASEMGGAEAVARQHEAGKLTVRERIEALCDKGSFRERGGISGVPTYDDDGNLLSTDTESAWLAGENGALPGFIMPADLGLGFNYYQEFAPADEALDEGTTFADGLEQTIGLGLFDDVIAVLETSALDPEARELKYYAPGLGLVAVEEGYDELFEEFELRAELVAIVPEPGSLALLGIAMTGMCVRTRRSS